VIKSRKISWAEQHSWERSEMHTKFYSGKLKERESMEELIMDRRETGPLKVGGK
jgi:hypothetical protein